MTLFAPKVTFLPDLDRYVMVGNHRDAWVFGGVDASSGGSVLLELARVMGEQMKAGEDKSVLDMLLCLYVSLLLNAVFFYEVKIC